MCAVLLPALFASAQTKTLRIAAAADLQPVLPSLIHNFEKSSGAKVEVSYASSATLATQILNGAPYDIFLAANLAFPQKVVAANLAEESAPITYAHGSLVLWARHGLFHHGLTMQSLTSPTVHRIAVANPVHAPYGAAAMAAIQSLGLKVRAAAEACLCGKHRAGRAIRSVRQRRLCLDFENTRHHQNHAAGWQICRRSRQRLSAHPARRGRSPQRI